jgi:hypothetical protein
MQLASSRRHFTTHENDSDLCDFVSSLGFANMGPADLDAMREQYKAFIAPFSDALLTTGAVA